MKKELLIIMIIVLASCIPLREYNILRKEMDEVTASRKKVKKEVAWLEIKNKQLEDSITSVIELSKLMSTKIEKRLAAKGILVKLAPNDLTVLSIYNQEFGNDYYAGLLKNNNFSDTNSAKTTKGLSSKEKELIYWLNYARLDPGKFCMKYIYPLYLNNNTNVYIATLMDYMLHMKPVPALIPDNSLYESARCHAESMGNEGVIGHKRIQGCQGKFSGECCSYGLSDPLQIVLQLLIDQGVSSLGHRYICLGTYNKIGVSIKPHKSYGTNAVLDFSYLSNYK